MKQVILLLSLACFFLLIRSANGQSANLPQPIVVNSDKVDSIQSPLNLIRYFIEDNHPLAIQDVSTTSFQKQFNVLKSPLKELSGVVNIWFQYRVKNLLNRPVTVAISGYVFHTDVYIATSGENFKPFTTGWNVPWNRRDGIKDLYKIIYTIPANGVITVFMRDQNFEKTDLPENWVTYPADQYLKDQYLNSDRKNTQTIIQGTLTGFFIFAAIFNFFFFYTTREKVYLIFGLCIFFYVLLSWAYTPVVLREMPGSDSYLVGGAIYVLTIISFMYTLILFLRMPQYHPVWAKIILGGSILHAAIMLLWQANYTFGDKNFSVRSAGLVFALTNILQLLYFALAGVVIVMDLIKKRRGAQIFMLAVGPCLLIGIISKVHNFPVLRQLSLIWGVLIMNWSLFDRFKLLQEERNQLVVRQKMELEKQVAERTSELSHSLADLKATQAQLIQSEKMASLGELTAGIAHEIQNPLNFVNNFSEVSVEMIGELKEELAKGDIEEAVTIATDVEQNLEKIRHHGKRADGIVKGMLEHSRASAGQKEPADLNKLADEYLRLAYHGLRAKDKIFNAELVTTFDENLPPVNIIPQDIGRVLLNLFNNAFYATQQKQKVAGENYKPEVTVTTSAENGQVVIKVRDNGNGIPDNIKDKIMQPFFTTKPTGQGTGLGLSLSYDIIVKGHGGQLTATSEEGEFTQFEISISI